MAQDKDYAPLTTVIYVIGDTPSERKDNLRACLFHAANHCGEGWLGEPGFEQNVSNAHDTLEDTDPGISFILEEADFRPPIHQLRILHGKGPRTAVNGLVKGATSSDRRIDVIVTTPDPICNRSEGIENIETLVDGNNNVHFAVSGLTVQSGTSITGTTKRALISITDALHPAHEHDTEATYAWSGGRPPIGFEVDGDRLVESEDYSRICRILQQYIDGIKSQRRAAKDIGCSRATIVNAVEQRPSMYNLQ
ncbi:hypothetical protein OB955_03750 [Halobacteria archaeon AArc-m2/3/4]|uniref:Uncharacterized protein n=1 Tax=Natronoglomus mannanivorans TaxID=2979990 RepID=A0ABT2QA96_9EURY|nr:hypothetical protein [Halobacteria archaeon AArc-m2/3/4]